MISTASMTFFSFARSLVCEIVVANNNSNNNIIKSSKILFERSASDDKSFSFYMCKMHLIVVQILQLFYIFDTVEWWREGKKSKTNIKMIFISSYNFLANFIHCWLIFFFSFTLFSSKLIVSKLKNNFKLFQILHCRYDETSFITSRIMQYIYCVKIIFSQAITIMSIRKQMLITNSCASTIEAQSGCLIF